MVDISVYQEQTKERKGKIARSEPREHIYSCEYRWKSGCTNVRWQPCMILRRERRSVQICMHSKSDIMILRVVDHDNRRRAREKVDQSRAKGARLVGGTSAMR